MNEVSIDRAGNPLASPIRAKYCQSFLCRLQGLMFHDHLDHEEGLLLVGSRESRLDAAIHMIGVKMDLAVFWLDDDLQVVDKVFARKWRPLYVPGSPAKYILELSAERINDLDIGEMLTFEESSAL